ncbi:MAG: hypothetical protein SFX18_00335 [Pirellulales bacterium]|nr:hypothetical protein [Pirellulales bacterium]
MAKRLEVPRQLQHLLEKRDSPERRSGERRAKTDVTRGTKDAPPVERRQKNRRGAKRRTGD